MPGHVPARGSAAARLPRIPRPASPGTLAPLSASPVPRTHGPGAARPGTVGAQRRSRSRLQPTCIAAAALPAAGPAAGPAGPPDPEPPLPGGDTGTGEGRDRHERAGGCATPAAYLCAGASSTARTGTATGTAPGPGPAGPGETVRTRTGTAPPMTRRPRAETSGSKPVPCRAPGVPRAPPRRSIGGGAAGAGRYRGAAPAGATGELRARDRNRDRGAAGPELRTHRSLGAARTRRPPVTGWRVTLEIPGIAGHCSRRAEVVRHLEAEGALGTAVPVQPWGEYAPEIRNTRVLTAAVARSVCVRCVLCVCVWFAWAAHSGPRLGIPVSGDSPSPLGGSVEHRRYPRTAVQ